MAKCCTGQTYYVRSKLGAWDATTRFHGARPKTQRHEKKLSKHACVCRQEEQRYQEKIYRQAPKSVFMDP